MHVAQGESMFDLRKFFLAAIVLQPGLTAPVHAQNEPSRAPVNDTCVDVQVNGRAVLSYACLSRQMLPAAGSTSTLAVADGVQNVSSNRRVGQYNQSAFGQRMGDNLGKSVHPARPPAASPPALPVLKPGG
ncbi:hypothetical protein [Pinirhizobacter soli]|uniref:hypothetical protein n=1 Tax=Pinirhizobacter soli TaxID=2786953 RepID=UPI00202AB547|nr:hypothetical protein [Pinirhizobacter soli]